MKIIPAKLVITFTIVIFSLILIQCSPNVIDDLSPTCTIIYPVEGQVVSGVDKIVVGASDNEDLKEVLLYIDGTHVFTTQEKLFEYQWDTAPLANNQNHSIHAIAYDEENNVGFSGATTVRVASGSFPDTLAPEITIVYPVTGSTLKGTVPVIPNISDNIQIKKVEYYVDGILEATINQAPYDFQWNLLNFEEGSTHYIFGKAYDENDNIGVSEVIAVVVDVFTPADPPAPEITILYPVEGSTIKGTIQVIPQISTDNNIKKVEYFVDGLLETTVNQSPYEFTWDLSAYAAGTTHYLFGRAFDENDNSSVSQVVSITIAP